MNEIKAIIGLGNPGRQYHKNRHNIGFRIVDALADKYGATWQTKDLMEYTTANINGHSIILIKPQTFMNTSGKVYPFLGKQGIKAENIVVVHDELELPFGEIKTKVGGSAKGHNGLKSIIAACGDMFARLRFGIGRPEQRERVPDYVLEDFAEDVEPYIEQAVNAVQELVG